VCRLKIIFKFNWIHNMTLKYNYTGAYCLHQVSISTRLLSTTSQKTVIFILVAVKLRSSLPCPQEPTAQPYPESHESSPLSLSFNYFEVYFNSIVSSTPKFQKFVFPSSFPTKTLNPFLTSPMCDTFLNLMLLEMKSMCSNNF
jgi:hypothetical protein